MVEQVACQFPATRATATELQRVVGVLPIVAVKATLPEGSTGVNVAPPSVAVKITEASTLEAPGLVKLRVAAVAFTICVIVAAVATVKLTSPE